MHPYGLSHLSGPVLVRYSLFPGAGACYTNTTIELHPLPWARGLLASCIIKKYN